MRFTFAVVLAVSASIVSASFFSAQKVINDDEAAKVPRRQSLELLPGVVGNKRQATD